MEPIKKLRAATKEVAKGNFDVQIEDNKENEVGDLIQDFNMMVRDLASIETLRNDFIANVSHEFKTPIASIEGCALLLQDSDLTEEERREYAKLIASSAHSLSVLISNILKLSKIENQEIIPEQQKIDLDEQLRQCILILEPQWSGKNINLDIDLDKVEMFGNDEMLSQVWINIIGNAIKFTDNGGNIGIRLYDDDENIMVSIKDDGIGMSEEVQRHIFDKFYQGDKTHSGEGNGLGLPLVKRIVDMHGGKIAVDSAPGEGSCFTVYFPKYVVLKNKKKSDTKSENKK